MPMNNLRFNLPESSSPLHPSAQKFNQLQSDLVSTARMLAVDEVGAAMAHQLNEPLTALLLYLHEIRDRGQHSIESGSAADSMREMVDNALQETERVCEIMNQMGHTVCVPMESAPSVAPGVQFIESNAQGSNVIVRNSENPATPRAGQNRLTPRECEVLALITGGSSNKEGGYRLGISTRTFEVHRAHIMEKYGAKNAADLVRMALSQA